MDDNSMDEFTFENTVTITESEYEQQRSIFRRHVFLRDPLTYGASGQKMWVRGARIDGSVQWSMLVTWREIEGWLLLSPSGIPSVYLSLARVKEEGLYDRVSELAKRYAPEFNKAPRPGVGGLKR
jgi:hypothetical protein